MFSCPLETGPELLSALAIAVEIIPAGSPENTPLIREQYSCRRISTYPVTMELVSAAVYGH